MKLSEAIMLNGMTKPQGRGVGSMGAVDAPCAMGGALQRSRSKGPRGLEESQ